MLAHYHTVTRVVVHPRAAVCQAKGMSGSPAYEDRWHRTWKKGVVPGQEFDVGGPAPALVKLLDGGTVDVRGKKVFVPGCGRGYDVVELAQRGGQVVGLDLVPEAAEEARRYAASHLGDRAQGKLEIKTGKAEESGPPWPLSKELYTELLQPHGFVQTYDSPAEVGPLARKAAAAGGKEAMTCWQKKL